MNVATTPGRSWVTPAAAVFSGLLLALAFPPYEQVILLPVAPVAWLVALVRETSRARAFLSGVLFALAYWCASIPWIFFVVTHYGGQNALMGVVCLLLLALILAQWPAVVAWGTAAAAPAGSARRLAVFPLLWMASEHARSFVYGGFPWNLTGTALYRHPVWIQTAAVWGVFGVGGAVLAVSALVAASAAFRRFLPLGAASLLVLAAGVFGAFRLGRAVAPGPVLSVALLQPNLHEEDRAADPAGSYAAVLEQARTAARHRPDLIVIPESALPAYWQESAMLRRDLSEVAGTGRVLFNDVESTADGRSYNVARLLGPSGLVGAPYRKVHLVPFGEYVPLPKVFFFVRKVSREIGAFSAAAAPTTLGDGNLRIGVGVCYEITYPSLAREEVRQGATLLATISNDSWYGKAGAQAQHFAGAVLRSVETRRSLVRAAITGISGIVDDRGRILAQLPPDRPGILEGRVRLAGGSTPWLAWGFWIPRLADALAAAVLLFGLARWWSARSARRGPSTSNGKTEP